MKEKDTKRKKEKVDLSTIPKNSTYLINKNIDHQFYLSDSKLSEKDITKEIDIIFEKPEIQSNIQIRVVMENDTNINIVVKIIAKEGIEGIESKLDMQALLVNPNSAIQFVPCLEIDELNVSVDHKSSIGSPSKEWIRYLESRGLEAEDSLKLLKNAFFLKEV